MDAAEAESIRDRWESGKEMLSERTKSKGPKVGRPGLPKARMDELVTATGKGRRELGYRMQFAEQNRTEVNLCTALQKLESQLGHPPTWTEVKANLPKPTGTKTTTPATAATMSHASCSRVIRFLLPAVRGQSARPCPGVVILASVSRRRVPCQGR